MDTDSAGASVAKHPQSSDKGLAQVASAGTAPSLLRYAAQPDVVLSLERDAYYADTLLGEGASELVETLLGSRRAMILAPELRAVASCLYFGLTNFAGKQTLGQEYCDVALVRDKDATSPMSRGSLQAYTLLRVVVPYLQERLREGWHGLRSLRNPFGGGGAAAAMAAARARARARIALAPPIGIATSSSETPAAATEVSSLEQASPTSALETGAVVGDSDGGVGSAVLSAVSPSPQRDRVSSRAPGRLRPPAVSAAAENLGRLLAWARRKRPAVSGVLEWLLRLHLAAFYFDGRFANFAMRAAGARLSYTREQDEPRARYAILGIFLLAQAAAEAASASAAAVARRREATEAARVEGFPGGAGAVPGGDARGVDVVGEDGGAVFSRVPAVSPERTPADAALFPRSRRRCSLCMSPRENTAATPCGHLFCWECIVGWCQTNPECPLCRQPATPQSIVCLYQYP